MYKNQKTKRTVKILSVALLMAILIGNILGCNVLPQSEPYADGKNQLAGGAFTPLAFGDPLEYMIDLPVEPRRAGDDIWADGLNGELPEMDESMRREFELREEEHDDGSTDRYIVRYKSGQKNAFQSKLSAMVERSENIAASADGAESEWEVLTLSEKILPSEFAAAITISRAVDDIEYIQPDYELSLDNFDEDDDEIPEDTSEEDEEEEPTEDPTEEETTDEVFEEEPAEEEGFDEDEPTDEETTEPLEEPTDEPDEDELEPTETDEEFYEDETDEIINLFESGQNGEIIVAVIDTGVDIYHSYLDGYMDTDNMWDFTQNTSQIYNPANPLDSAHGTHIAGIIANTARENDIGNIKILPLRVFDNGVAYTSDVIAAIEYAVAQGATIINCSFGSTQDNPALEETIANADALFVCAVGNSRRDFVEKPSCPAGYDLPNVISVASVNADGGFSYFSNYGTNIDITALGRNVRSSFPENEYGTLTGTSMAAAYVTAVAAIVGANEEQSAYELRDRLIYTGDKLSNLQNKVNQGRRVNLENAIDDIVQTNITQNDPEDDFDVHGYQPTESELFELYNSGSASVVQVSAGGSYTLALKSDGTVWAWGRNNYGQLGNGLFNSSETLIKVIGLSDVKAIFAGDFQSLALKNDGTVWAWGRNDYGQLGDGTKTNRSTPIQITGLSGVTAISAGGWHSLALKNDGTVWAWGRNDSGQLGDGTTSNKSTPAQVTGLGGVTAISAGSSHSLALKNDGIVWAWGNNNYYGKLGDGTTEDKSTPVQVKVLSGITAISAGSSHSLALKNDGTVWAWGYNYYGQLGNGATMNSSPVQAKVLNGVVAISAGGSFSLALKNDGTVWAWGSNSFCQLGDGAMFQRTTPIYVTGLDGMKNISSGDRHSLALKNDGTVWAWGYNHYGQLGNITAAIKSTPLQVTGLSDVKAISAGDSHSLALKNDGTVWAWGYNNCGQLGDGTTTNKSIPVQVTGLSGVTAISAGDSHSLALKNDGTLQAWGYNEYGQLGLPFPKNSSIPVLSQKKTKLYPPEPLVIQDFASGGSHTIVLTDEGEVWAWGHNGYGQLGDGTNMDSSEPVLVKGLTHVVAISAGLNHSMALKSDGTLWAWGQNNYGQLGDGTTINRSVPIKVNGLNNMMILSAGGSHSTALKSDLSLWAWGRNTYGQVGNGSKKTATLPVLTGLINPEIEDSDPDNPESSITKEITANSEFTIVCSLYNITSFGGQEFKITYNPAQITLVDFAAQTPEIDVHIGIVPGTTLQILSHNTTTGVLTFKINETVAPGQMWSGAVTVLRFKGKLTGSTTIDFEYTPGNGI